MPFQISARFFKISHILSAFSIALLLLLTACGGGGGGDGDDGGDGDGGGGGGVAGLSQHGSTNSHTDNRRGDNCLKSGCHSAGGSGTGVFITAGTAMSAIGGYIEYYSSDTLRDPSTLVAKLQIDAYGNFYTVTPIDVLTPNIPNGSGGFASQGGYVTVVSPGGTKRNMSGLITHTNSGCNFCHRLGGVKSPL